MPSKTWERWENAGKVPPVSNLNAFKFFLPLCIPVSLAEVQIADENLVVDRGSE